MNEQFETVYGFLGGIQSLECECDAIGTDPPELCYVCRALDALAKIEAEHERVVKELTDCGPGSDCDVTCMDNALKADFIRAPAPFREALGESRNQDSTGPVGTPYPAAALYARIQDLEITIRKASGLLHRCWTSEAIDLLDKALITGDSAEPNHAAPEQKCSTCGESKGDGLTCSNPFHLEGEYRVAAAPEPKEPTR